MQRAISPQQTRVSEASGSHQHRDQKRCERTGWINVIRRSPSDRHVLPNRFHKADFVQEGNENRDPSEGVTASCVSDQSLVRQQGVDLALEWFVRCV
jgi:hypothetical protein